MGIEYQRCELAGNEGRAHSSCGATAGESVVEDCDIVPKDRIATMRGHAPLFVTIHAPSGNVSHPQPINTHFQPPCSSRTYLAAVPTSPGLYTISLQGPNS